MDENKVARFRSAASRIAKAGLWWVATLAILYLMALALALLPNVVTH